MRVPAEFERYARHATAGIDSRRERAEAHAELVEHLMAALDDEMASGADEATAIARVLDRMGDADEVADPIERVHTPRWNWRVLLLIGGIAVGVMVGLWLILWILTTIVWGF